MTVELNDLVRDNAGFDGDLSVVLGGTVARSADDDVVRLHRPVLVGAGRRQPLATQTVRIGRDAACDVVLPEATEAVEVTVELRGGGHVVEDLAGGASVNGAPVPAPGHLLEEGDSLQVGAARFHYLTGQEARLPRLEDAPAAPRAHTVLTLGSGPGNHLVLPHPAVSTNHAELRLVEGHPVIRRCSRAGALRVDGRAVDRAALYPGAEVGVGPYRFLFDGTTLVPLQRHGVRLAVDGVVVDVDGKRILHPTSLTVEPGELIAIVGESGAGKSTLLKAIAGVIRPSYGRVRVDGDDVAVRREDVGYVPQDEIVHPQLTIAEALDYAAALRLPAGTSRAARRQAVQRVLAELDLAPHAGTQIRRLSGGERRRVGVAAELLSHPAILCLDEPTTGLDSGLERRAMHVLRRLASRGRTVIAVTHATRTLDLCDRIVVVERGGVVSFDGPPAAAREHFGVRDLADLFEAVPAVRERLRQAVVAAQQRQAARAVPAAAAAPSRRRCRRGLKHARVLTARYALVLGRDWRNAALLVAQVPVLALGIALLFPGDVLSAPDRAGDAALLLFLTATTAVWLGAISASREVVKERALMRREAAIGVGLGAYLASKVVVLFALAAVQSATLGVLVLALRPPGEELAALGGFLAVLVGSAWSAVLLGLVVSSLARSEDQATTAIPLLLIPQLLYAGAVVPVAAMSGALAALADLAIARWGFAGTGAAFAMNDRIEADTAFRPVSRYGPDFFALSPRAVALTLAASLALHLLALVPALFRAAHGRDA